MRIALLALFLAFPASASADDSFMRAGTMTVTGYDEFHFLGWDNACGAAFSYFSYPPTGTGMRGIPSYWKIGKFEIAPGDGKVESTLADFGSTLSAWSSERAERATKDLLGKEFTAQGHHEFLRDAPIPDHPDLDEMIDSTSALQLAHPVQWPTDGFKLHSLHFSPLSNCAFLVFQSKQNPMDSYRFQLVSILNPGIRRERSRAHVTKALYLYNNESDIYGAEEELHIAVAMDAEHPLALYYHALLLSTHGRFDLALERLKAAVTLDPSYKRKALAAIEFKDLRRDKRFRGIVGKRGFFP